MQSEIILAGFGGQGVLLIGKIIALTGMDAGREVTWMPAYGPEMRGGTCNCTVVVGEKQIGSPISKRPHSLIALNLPSLDKFEDDVRPDGLIVSNSSLINRSPRRKDVKVVEVPANEIAIEAGSPRAANMVALGAFIGASGLLELDGVVDVLDKNLSRNPKLAEINRVAVTRGFELARNGA